MPLLGPGDPPTHSVRNADAGGALLLIADHNGVAIPQALAGLGLPPEEMRRHIACDIGVGSVAEILSDRLGAPLVAANYSRLVIDCNRPPGTPESVPAVADGTVVPANAAVAAADRAAREREIFAPYHRAIEDRIAAMTEASGAPALVALHSFTPILDGVSRPWDIGILWNEDDRLARPLIAELSSDPSIAVGDNLPYSGRSGPNYSTCRHAERAGLVHAGVEFRQDLIDFPAGAGAWARRLGDALLRVLDFRSRQRTA